ncbi:MAG: hypothetical protein LBT74_04760 [Acidobacteriota bacterium]|jgi:nucleoside phosphorylase|nr:hypothetical protein [Acidobacteriota bacterium]
MILIVAALEEELRTATDCWGEVRRLPGTDLPLWCAQAASEQPVAFLRSGVGPKKSAARLNAALERVSPELVLVAGYAGALDPGLRVGDLVAVARATPFRLGGVSPDWDHVEAGRPFDLDAAALVTVAEAAGLAVAQGGALSSKHVLGNPVHKGLLFRRFQASVVDMETAFLVREAASRGIPAAALRVVSDTAQDDFLEAFERDSAVGLAARARKLVRGNPASAWRTWRENAAKAQGVLRRFWKAYRERCCGHAAN